MTAFSSAKAVTFVYTRDRAAAKAFYGKILGLKHLSDSDASCDFALDGSQLSLVTISDHTPTAHPVLSFDIPDANAAARELATKGVALTIYPGFGQDDLGLWTSPDGSKKLGWFTDPDGNCLMLSQG
jgi:catechol 2,3-dioxygenase-like lactoylglutathione lyase family enzyme